MPNKEEILKKVEEWNSYDRNTHTKEEVSNLVANEDYDKLQAILFNRLEFGTAGLRARMGAGYARMNDVTVIQTTIGFLKYLQSKFPNDLTTRGVVIGYDYRHNSERFAHLTATVFLESNVKCYLYRKIVATPFVPYAVTKYKACAGIMITASHNPKDDNGYKVYWDNGSQIIPPHDSGIASEILANLESCRDDKYWNDTLYKSSPNRIDPYDEIMTSYYTDLKAYCRHSDINSQTSLRFAYTPVHGVGLEFAEKSFATFSHQPFVPVPEQMNPDPEFPTVEYPNPEEGKGVLRFAMKTAEANNCSVILANDPDADRLAVAEKQKDGSWKIFTGNELGALFGWWALQCHTAKNPNIPKENVYMLSSTVSSMILSSIADVVGIKFEDTLTGFKWMGNRADQLMKEGKTVLYAFEEAIGYMFGTNVLDKDGVSACSVIAEAACCLKLDGLTLTDKLQEIYHEYGFHVSNNSYYLCYDQSKLLAMFNRLRNYPGNDVIKDAANNHQYPRHLDCYEIKHVRDLTTGFDSRTTDGKAVLPSSSSSQMLTFYFTNGCTLTLRTSGTEPKIKYYSEMKGKPNVKGNETSLKEELDDLVTKMCAEFYQPEKNGFLPRPTS